MNTYLTLANLHTQEKPIGVYALNVYVLGVSRAPFFIVTIGRIIEKDLPSFTFWIGQILEKIFRSG